MGKSKISPDAANMQKYGVPFYGAAWVPYKYIGSPSKSEDEGKEDDGKDQSAVPGDHVVLAGGGGEGRSGIPNAIVLAHFDFASNSLSPEPVSPNASSLHPNRAFHEASLQRKFHLVPM